MEWKQLRVLLSFRSLQVAEEKMTRVSTWMTARHKMTAAKGGNISNIFHQPCTYTTLSGAMDLAGNAAVGYHYL